MTDRTYTQKELYQFVTEYSREAREEGFDMSVGDFVDWVASRDESIPPLHNAVYKQVSRSELCPECLNARPLGVAVKTGGGLCGRHKQEDTPVLPEKLPLYERIDHRTTRGLQEPDIRKTVNAIIDYLSRKEQ